MSHDCPSLSSTFKHQPIMTEEVMSRLSIDPEGYYIDGTFGRGGHAKALLKQLGPAGKLLALDCDPEAIQAGRNDPELYTALKEGRLILKHDNFSNMCSVAQSLQWVGRVRGIVLDLGVSSPQLDDPKRGFSFQKEGPLNMLMNPLEDSKGTLNAADWINQASEKIIADTLYTYGDERYSRRIAKAIVAARADHPFETTTELADVITQALPRSHGYHKRHPATRSFQAIRIFINQELSRLEEGIKQSLVVLAEGGRLVVITFHSLEARLFKTLTYRHAGPTWCEGEAIYQLKRLGSSIKPSREEVLDNPRSRCAIMRVAEKIKVIKSAG